MTDANPEPAPAAPEQKHGRAGRNLLAAVGMGVVLGIGFVLLPVLFAPWLFAIVVSIAMAVAAWELAGEFEQRGVRVERVVPISAACSWRRPATGGGCSPSSRCSR